MKTFACLALAALCGTSLHAQNTDGLSLKAGLLRPQDDLLESTRQNRGFFGEVGYRWDLSPEGFGLKGHAGYTRVARGIDQRLPSNDPASDLADYRNYYGGVDVLHPFKAWGQNFDFYAGLTMNSQKYNRNFAGLIEDRGWKLGYRLGVAYRITAKWGVDLGYGQAEGPRYIPRFREQPQPPPPAARLGPIEVRRDPSWFTVAATYRF